LLATTRLGMTIEAGLVIQELLLRHRARSVVRPKVTQSDCGRSSQSEAGPARAMALTPLVAGGYSTELAPMPGPRQARRALV